MSKSTVRFMGWKDSVITPLVSLTIIATASYAVHLVNVHWRALSLFANAVLFYFTMVALTVLVLKIIRMIFPLREGVYSYEENSTMCYIWNLQGFLWITHLYFFYLNPILAPPFRKGFYQLLGAKMGKGIISIGGRIAEPYLVSVEAGAMIGDDALILPHAILSSDKLVLGRVKIKSGAVIGAKAILMPGVTVGENAMVNAMAFVPMNTKIGPNEVWAGNPAKKIGEAKKVEAPQSRLNVLTKTTDKNRCD